MSAPEVSEAKRAKVAPNLLHVSSYRGLNIYTLSVECIVEQHTKCCFSVLNFCLFRLCPAHMKKGARLSRVYIFVLPRGEPENKASISLKKGIPYLDVIQSHPLHKMHYHQICRLVRWLALCNWLPFCAWDGSPLISRSPQHSRWALVSAKMHPAQ